MFGQLLDSIVQEALALRKPMLIVRSFDLFFSSHNIQYKILAYTPDCSYFSISYLVNLGICLNYILHLCAFRKPISSSFMFF